MNSCNDYLDKLNKKYGWSDYRIGKELGISKQAISGYRNGRSFFNDEVSYLIAKALDIDPLEVWLSVQIERKPKSPMTPILKKKSAEIYGRVALVLLSISFFITAIYPFVDLTAMYIMLSFRRCRKCIMTWIVIGDRKSIRISNKKLSMMGLNYECQRIFMRDQYVSIETI